jgi:hypothetical protein
MCLALSIRIPSLCLSATFLLSSLAKHSHLVLFHRIRSPLIPDRSDVLSCQSQLNANQKDPPLFSPSPPPPKKQAKTTYSPSSNPAN